MSRYKGLKGVGLTLGAGIALSAIGYLCYKATKKTDDEDLKEACIYMAVMDDEISRNELDNIDEVNLLSLRKSLKYRYDLFTEMYGNASQFKLEREIKRMEKRVKKSKESVEEEILDICEEE